MLNFSNTSNQSANQTKRSTSSVTNRSNVLPILFDADNDYLFTPEKVNQRLQYQIDHPDEFSFEIVT